MEETIPPYPVIPHFSILHRNEALTIIHFTLKKFLKAFGMSTYTQSLKQ